MSYAGTLKFDARMDAGKFQSDANKLGDIVKGLGVFEMIKKGFQMAGQQIDAAFNRIDTMEQFERTMTVMLGSTKQANQALQDTTAIVTGTAYGLTTAAQAVQSFTLAGMAIDLSTATVQSLADAVAFYGDGTDATLQQVTTAFGKMVSAGKVDMTNLNTILQANIPILEIWSEATGKSVADIRKEISSGSVSIDEFSQMMNLAMSTGTETFPSISGAAQEAGSSFRGSIDNMYAAITRGMTGIIQNVDAAAASVGSPTIRDCITNFGKGFEQVLNAVAKAVVPVIKNLDLIAPQLGVAAAAFVAFKVASAVAPILSAASAAMKVATASVTMLAAGETAAAVSATGLSVAQAVMTAAVGLANGTIGIATAVQLVWNAAMAANPILLIVILIAALVAAIVGLISWLNRGSEEYRKQKKEVEDLADAQEKLAGSMETSATAHEDNIKSIDAEANASHKLLDKLNDLSKVENKSAEEKRRMAIIVDQLNDSVEGLNLQYDEENDQLNMNIDQIGELIDARTALAKASALQERYGELIKEQAAIEEELLLIEKKRMELEEQLADGVLTQREYNKLIKELDNTTGEYTANMEENASRLEIVDQQIADADTAKAEEIIGNYEKIAEAFTSEGESIGDLAKKWGTTTEDIQRCLDEQGISLDEWVELADGLMEKHQENIDGHHSGIINSFKEIPKKYDMTAKEMTDVLEKNREQYAKWKENMATLSGQMSDEAIAELERLGPGANSVLEEMITNANGEMEAFDAAIQGGLSDAAEYANSDINKEEWAEAGLGMIENMAEGAGESDELAEAVTSSVENAKDTADEAVESTNFQSTGAGIDESIGEGMTGEGMESISEAAGEMMDQTKTELDTAVDGADFQAVGVLVMEQIVAGIQEADMSGVVEAMSGSFDDGASKIESIVTALKSSVVNTLKQMGSESASSQNAPLNTLAKAYQAGSKNITTTLSQLRNQANSTMRSMGQEMVNTLRSALDTMNSTVTSGAKRIETGFTSMKNGVVSILRNLSSEAKTIMQSMMADMAGAVGNGASSMKAAAEKVSQQTKAGFSSLPNDVRTVINNMMDGMLEAMRAKEQSLYNKAREIAQNIIDILNKAFDNRSPSHIMQDIFRFVMMGAWVSMDKNKGMLYTKTEEIGAGVLARFRSLPDNMSQGLAALMSSVAGDQSLASRLIATPSPALAGGGTTVINNFKQQNTMPKAMSEAQLTREAEDMLRRNKWQLP